MSDNATQLILEAHKGQSQFAYFQLGVAASAIAFAVHQTTGTALADAPWPMGLAVALWALSFALGCFGLDARQAGINLNAIFLQVADQIPSQLRASSEGAKFIEKMKADVGTRMDRTDYRFRWQKWTLFAGALAYVAGHMMQMATIPPRAERHPTPEIGEQSQPGRFESAAMQPGGK